MRLDLTTWTIAAALLAMTAGNTALAQEDGADGADLDDPSAADLDDPSAADLDDPSAADDESPQRHHPTVGRYTASVSFEYTERLAGYDGLNPLAIPSCPPAPTSVDQDAPMMDPAADCEVTAFEIVDKVELDGDPDVNPFAAGIALRFGYTLPSQLYVGAVLQLDLGEEQSGTSELGDVAGKASALRGGAELGVDLLAGPVVVRPLIGFGVIQVSAEACAPASATSDGGSGEVCEDTSTVQGYYTPGVDVLWFVADPVFVSAGTRFVGVTGRSSTVGVTGLATVGYAL